METHSRSGGWTCRHRRKKRSLEERADLQERAERKRWRRLQKRVSRAQQQAYGLIDRIGYPPHGGNLAAGWWEHRPASPSLDELRVAFVELERLGCERGWPALVAELYGEPLPLPPLDDRWCWWVDAARRALRGAR